ncbi:MAG: hypothetical protein ACE5JP_07270 [Candidatus Bipolaricaulia bacterium]
MRRATVILLSISFLALGTTGLSTDVFGQSQSEHDVVILFCGADLPEPNIKVLALSSNLITEEGALEISPGQYLVNLQNAECADLISRLLDAGFTIDSFRPAFSTDWVRILYVLVRVKEM